MIHNYMAQIRVRLPAILGIRMCPECPRCNVCQSSRRRWTYVPCNDRFGSNMDVMGGVIGGCPAIGGATEYQQKSPPHFHAQVHVACVYQYSTMPEIMERIRNGLLDASSIVNYSTSVHMESPPHQELYTRHREHLEDEWHKRFRAQEHDKMSTMPYFLRETTETKLWTDPEYTIADALVEARQYSHKYFSDAQYIFSRVQEHVHKKTKDGYVPLSGCLSQSCKTRCKHNFPRTAIDKRESGHHVICAGNARQFGCKITGKRNALGMILGQRSGEWQSGCPRSFAVYFRTNTNSLPNYRILPCATTHDNENCSKGCVTNKCEDVEMQKVFHTSIMGSFFSDAVCLNSHWLTSEAPASSKSGLWARYSSNKVQ